MNQVANPQPVTKELPEEQPRPPFASFMDRYAALVVDNLILFPIILALLAIQLVRMYAALKGADWALFFQNPEMFEMRYGGLMEGGMNMVGAFMQIPTWLYFIYLTHQNKGTPGKRLLKLEVLNKDGQKLPLINIILRETIGKMLSGFVFGLGFSWMLWDKNKQTWHDKIAQSYVYRTGENKKVKIAVIGTQIALVVITLAGVIGLTVWGWNKVAPLIDNTNQYQNGSNLGPSSEEDALEMLEQIFPKVNLTPTPLPRNIT